MTSRSNESAASEFDKFRARESESPAPENTRAKSVLLLAFFLSGISKKPCGRVYCFQDIRPLGSGIQCLARSAFPKTIYETSLSIEEIRQTPAPRRRFSGFGGGTGLADLSAAAPDAPDYSAQFARAGNDAGKPVNCLCGNPVAVKNRCLECTEILIDFISGAKMKAAEIHLKNKRDEMEAGAIKAGMLLILAKLSTQ